MPPQPAGPESDPKNDRRIAWIALVAAVVVAFSLAYRFSGDETSNAVINSTPEQAQDPATLAQCVDFLESCQRNGILYEVSFQANYTRVVVGPAFYAMSFDAKKGICAAISYVAKSRHAAPEFVLRDSQTNKQIGSFVTGILKLD